MNVKYNLSNLILLLLYVILLIPFLSLELYEVMRQYYAYIMLACMALMCWSFRMLQFHYNRMAAAILVFAAGIFILYSNHSGFGMIMQIVWPLMFIFVYRQAAINQQFVRWLYYTSLIFYVLVARVIFSYGDITEYINSPFQDAMNPNTAGNLIVCFTIFIVFCRGYLYPHRKKICVFLIYILSALLLRVSEARTALLALIVCLGFELFEESFRHRKRLLIAFVIGMFTLGVVIPGVYVKMWNAQIFTHTLILGKSFYTGRQYIWISFFRYIIKHLPESIFIGSGYNESFYIRETFNLHNAYLSIFACFGVCIFFAYIVYFVKVINRASKLNDNRSLSLSQYRLLQMLFFYLFIGLTETSLSFLQMLFPLGMSLGMMLNPRLSENISH